MKRTSLKILIPLLVGEYERKHFRTLGGAGRKYAEAQKVYALEQIDDLGIRATAKMLELPRRTLQRWARKYGKKVNRCPEWVYYWAYRRQKRRHRGFWERRGY